MHSNPPQPYTATQTAVLIGGPHCGQRWSLPADCHEFTTDAGDIYHFDPHATARFNDNRFIHSTLHAHLFAR